MPVREESTALSDDPAFLGQLVAAVGQAVIATDLTGTVIFWNDGAEAIFGWSAAEAMGRNLGSMVVPTEHVADAADIVSSVLDGRTWTGEFPVRHRDGHLLRVLVTDSAIRDASGEVVGIVGVSTDITDRTSMEQSLRRSEHRLRARFEHSAVPQLSMDAEAHVTAVNRAFCDLIGCATADFVGCHLFDVLPPRHRDGNGAVAGFDDLLGGRRTSLRIESTGPTATGESLVLQLDLSLLRDPDGSSTVLDAHVQDLTSLRRAEQALRVSEARYRIIADTAQEGIWAVDLDGKALYVNQMTADLLKRPLPEVYGHTPAEILDIDPTVIAERVRAARAGGPTQFEDHYLAPDGERRVLRVSVADLPDDEGNRIVGILLMISDVTAVVAAQEELTRQALQDPLTGLGNRTLLFDRLTLALNRSDRRPGRVAVLFADLDHLKEVNDSCGHADGDALLREVGRRISRSVRPGDTVARFGGDEFVVLCEEIDESAAADVAARLLHVLAEPVPFDGHDHHPTASIGLALSPPNDPEALLHEADLAMYEAKRRGRAQVVVRA